jgi:hypothetical protein
MSDYLPGQTWVNSAGAAVTLDAIDQKQRMGEVYVGIWCDSLLGVVRKLVTPDGLIACGYDRLAAPPAPTTRKDTP